MKLKQFHYAVCKHKQRRCIYLYRRAYYLINSVIPLTSSNALMAL